MIEQVMVPFVGFLRSAEPCILAHGPEAVAVHCRMNAACKRKLAGSFVHCNGLTIHLLYFYTGIGNEFFIAHYLIIVVTKFYSNAPNESIRRASSLIAFKAISEGNSPSVPTT